MKDKKLTCKGFTLIELLVVVLIIGILSSVALPQYTKAVRKSRIAEAKVILRAIINAVDLKILTEGSNIQWSDSEFENLDIEVPTESKNWEFHAEECITGNNGKTGCGAFVFPKFEPQNYDIVYWSNNYDGGPGESALAGKFICEWNNDEGKKICAGLGGKLVSGMMDRYEF